MDTAALERVAIQQARELVRELTRQRARLAYHEGGAENLRDEVRNLRAVLAAVCDAQPNGTLRVSRAGIEAYGGPTRAELITNEDVVTGDWLIRVAQ